MEFVINGIKFDTKNCDVKQLIHEIAELLVMLLEYDKDYPSEDSSDDDEETDDEEASDDDEETDDDEDDETEESESENVKPNKKQKINHDSDSDSEYQ